MVHGFAVDAHHIINAGAFDSHMGKSGANKTFLTWPSPKGKVVIAFVHGRPRLRRATYVDEMASSLSSSRASLYLSLPIHPALPAELLGGGLHLCAHDIPDTRGGKCICQMSTCIQMHLHTATDPPSISQGSTPRFKHDRYTILHVLCIIRRVRGTP